LSTEQTKYNHFKHFFELTTGSLYLMAVHEIEIQSTTIKRIYAKTNATAM